MRFRVPCFPEIISTAILLHCDSARVLETVKYIIIYDNPSGLSLKTI